MSLLEELELALLRHPAEVQTNTPPDVLAEHMLESLKLFEKYLLRRSNHSFYHPDRK